MLAQILYFYFQAQVSATKYYLFRLLLVAGLLLLFPCSIQAQPNLIKGIELPSLSDKTDTAHIMGLLRIGQKAETTSLDTAELYFQKALKLSRQYRDSRLTALALGKLGYLYQIKGDNDLSISFFKQAIVLAKKNDDKEFLLNLYNSLSATYTTKGSLSMSIVNNYKALKVIQNDPKLRNTLYAAETYNGMFSSWSGMSEPELGFPYLDTAEQIARRFKDTSLLITLTINRSVPYFNSNRAYARKLLTEALKNARIVGNKQQEITCLAYLGTIASQENKVPEAFSYLNKILRLRKGMPMIEVQLMPDLYLANAYYRNKEYVKAERDILKVIEKAKAVRNRFVLWQAYGLLANIYATTGQYELAYRQGVFYGSLLDSMQRIEKGKTVEFLLQYQSIEKDKNIAQKQLHITEQRKKLQQKNFWIGGISISAFLLAALSLVLYRNYHHKQQLQDATILNLQQQQKIDQLQAVMKGEENERNRIARELHDGIGSQIAAARMHLDIFKETDTLPPYAHSYKSGMALLDDAYLGLRYTAHNLLPGQLLEKGLVAAVQEYCGKISRPGLFQIHFQTFGVLPELAPDKALSIYRIIQELIHNSAKHSGATEVIVELGAEETRLAVSVEDNGMGWKIAEEIPEGIGMSNLKQRVSLLEGTLEIDSRQNIGTTLYLSFSFEKII